VPKKGVRECPDWVRKRKESSETGPTLITGVKKAVREKIKKKIDWTTPSMGGGGGIRSRVYLE